MAVSAARAAKHALVLLLRALAAAYGVTLSSGLSRDSLDNDVESAFRRISLKAHPDKGGSKVDQERLNAAREKWHGAQKVGSSRPKGGRPPKTQASGTARPVADTPAQRGYRVHSTAVLLTYQGLAGPELWEPFVDFAKENQAPWKVKYWTATFEANSQGSACHAHLMLQFKAAVDCTTHGFAFRGVLPNASTTDLMGDGLCRKRLQQSIDRGDQYVCAIGSGP